MCQFFLSLWISVLHKNSIFIFWQAQCLTSKQNYQLKTVPVQFRGNHFPHSNLTHSLTDITQWQYLPQLQQEKDLKNCWGITTLISNSCEHPESTKSINFFALLCRLITDSTKTLQVFLSSSLPTSTPTLIPCQKPTPNKIKISIMWKFQLSDKKVHQI